MFNPLKVPDLYQELKQSQNHSSELSNCVDEVTQSLLNVDRDPLTQLRKPICLLGKIQSGKTRCMIGVMAQAFNHGIKQIVVLTKNSTLLGKQTTRRIAREINNLPSGKSVKIDYITNINTEHVLQKAEQSERRIIVGIKHHSNVHKIYRFLVESNPQLKEHEVLIIDDEADISSIGYRKVTENVLAPDQQSYESQTRDEQLLVAEQISQLRHAFENHYYLQVTATPASIFLQPEDLSIVEYSSNYEVNHISKPSILADKTVILPIHEHYIGGEFFFGEANDPQSLASHTHVAVQTDELKRLLKRDQRHINHIFGSGNFPSITHLVDQLLLSVACHVIALLKANQSQQEIKSLSEQDWAVIFSNIKSHLEGFTAMVHVSTQTKIHSYHKELIDAYLGDCLGAVSNDVKGRRALLKKRLFTHYTEQILPALKLFKQQHNCHQDPEVLEQAPLQSYLCTLDQDAFDDLFLCYRKLLEHEHVKSVEINSVQSGSDYINPTSGELRRDVLANIYVGGQALDRGITVQRMLGFFYGRDPKVAQLDTTLQHARIYGARSSEDLVFTRLYMSSRVHDRLVEITQIDQVLRETISRHNGDNRFAAIELGKTGVRPTSPSRLMKSDCVILKSHKRLLPVGFKTRKGQACAQEVQKLDHMIKHNFKPVAPHSSKEIFKISWADFELIFNQFERYTVKREDWAEGRKTEDWQLERLRAYYKIIKQAYFPQQDELLLMVKRGRNLNRLKNDGRTPQNAPDTGKLDGVEMISLMKQHGMPGLFLFEQSGREVLSGDGLNLGWSGERFYWPLLMLPELERSIMISLDALNA